MMRPVRARRFGGVLAAAVTCLAGCSSDEVSVGDTGVNQPPRIEWLALEPAEPASGETIRARVRAQDPEADPVDIRYAWEVGGVPRMEAGPSIELKGLAKGTAISVTAVASDGVSESEAVEKVVRIRNQRPRLTQARIEPWESVARGETLIVKSDATDGDGDELVYRYRWHVNGSSVEGDGSSFPTANLSPGDVVYARVVAGDGEVDSDPVDTARVRVAGAVPRIVSTPVGLSADGSFRYRVEVEYIDGSDGLRFSLRESPVGMEMNPATGEVVWAPAPGQIGDFPVEIEVVDARGTKAVQAFRINVGISSNSPPASPADR